MEVGKSNRYYLQLPAIQLDQAPILTLQVEGPGKSMQTAQVGLAPIQKAIIRHKIETCLLASTELNQKMEACLRLPLNGAHELQAQGLTYTVQELAVSKGSLHFERGGVLKVGSKLVMGPQELLFKPTGEIGEAQIALTVVNNQGGQSQTSLLLTVKPVGFQVDVLTKMPTQADQQLIPGHVGIVEIKLSEIDPALAEETWKIRGWQFSETKSSLPADLSLQKVDLSFIEPSKGKQLQKAYQEVLEQLDQVHSQEQQLKTDTQAAVLALSQQKEALQTAITHLDKQQQTTQATLLHLAKQRKEAQEASWKLNQQQKETQEALVQLEKQKKALQEAVFNLEKKKKDLQDQLTQVEQEQENLPPLEQKRKNVQEAIGQLEKKQEAIITNLQALKEKKQIKVACQIKQEGERLPCDPISFMRSEMLKFEVAFY